jgi:hypothetical protein
MRRQRKTKRKRGGRRRQGRARLNKFISDTSLSGLSNRPVYTINGKVGGYFAATDGSGDLVTNQITFDNISFFKSGGGSDPTALYEQMSMFTQYRPIKITAHVRPLTDSPGVTFFTWTSYDYLTNPVGVTQSRSLCLNNSYKIDQNRSLLWVPSDLHDLAFFDIGATSLNLISFWMYTNNGTYSSPVSTSLFLIEFECTVQVRGQAYY